MCDKCQIDQVSLLNIVYCTTQSLIDLFEDLQNGEPFLPTFLKHDRIYYVCLTLILLFLIRVVFFGTSKKEIRF